MFISLLVATAFLFTGCKTLDSNLSVRDSSSVASDKLFDYQQIALDNGLSVVTLEDFSTPIVAAHLWYHVGSKNEDPRRQGFAHMFEHMMFKGTDRVAEKDHFAFIQRVGGTNNAYTSFDQTVYTQTLPSDQLALALWLEAERMSFLRIDQQSFDTERSVVEEELRMGENRPYGTLFKKEFADLFEVHPYQWTPIGKLAHLRAASVAELRAFWTEYYVPNNATLVIVGAVKHAEAQALAREYFGWIPRCPQPPTVESNEPQPSKPHTFIIDDENAPAPLAMIVWKTVPHGHPDEMPLDLAAEILGGGNSSRLYREIVAEKQMAVDSSASTFNLEQNGIFSADATLAPGQDNSAAVLDAITKHVERIQQQGVTEKELEKARNQSLKSIVTTNLTIDRKAQLLGTAAVIQGDTAKVNEMLDDIRRVTIADIQRVASTYITPDKSYTFIIKQNDAGALAGAKDAEDVPVTAKPEQDSPPPGRKNVKRPKDFPKKAPFAPISAKNILPTFTKDRLPNGMNVIVVENHEVPFVSITLGLLNAAWTEKKPGTASITLQMLTKGTKTHTEGALAAELEQYAISLSGSAGMDTSEIHANCLTEYVDRTTELLAEVILEPVFDAAEFEKLRKQVLTGLAIEQESPRYAADRELRRRLYGNHPYARTSEGEVADVEALTPDDAKAWWESFARPEEATLILAGDIDRGTALAVARKYLGDWKLEGARPDVQVAEMLPASPTHIYIVDRPGSMQTEIRVGQLGIRRRQQPEYFVSRIVSNYFGGSFNSRINDTIRVKKGLTYGAHGGYYAQNLAGDFEIGTFTKNESAAETVKTIFEELERLRNEGPSAEVLADSKSYFAGSFVRTRETPQQVAGDLWLVEAQSLGDEYFEKLLSKIADTSARECLELVAETVDPGKMVVVVVGDASKIKESLAEIAPVTVTGQ
jgi:zinc protease